MSTEISSTVMEEVAGLVRLYRCPLCQQRRVLQFSPLVAVNIAGTLIQQVYCESCEQMLWLKCADLGQHYRLKMGGKMRIYAIGYAEEIAARRNEIGSVPLEMLVMAMAQNGDASLNWQHVPTTDLSKPIILAASPVPHPDPNETRECIIVIDGWHRIAHAISKGAGLRSFKLTAEELAECLAFECDLETEVPA